MYLWYDLLHILIYDFEFQMIPLDTFKSQSADGRTVAIVPGGHSIPLTFSNRKEYVDRALAYRLHEMDAQVFCQEKMYI